MSAPVAAWFSIGCAVCGAWVGVVLLAERAGLDKSVGSSLMILGIVLGAGAGGAAYYFL